MLEKNGKNTEFSNTLSLNIGYAELMDKIVFNDVTSYKDYYGNTYPSNPIYTYTKIEKDNLVEILGEDGYINVLSKTGEKVSTLNKENLEVRFENEETGLVFETSKPINEGILKLENGRAIKPLEYAKTQEELFDGMKITLNANLVKDEKVIISGNKENVVEMTNPITDASLKVGTDKLSTVVKNENIELRVTLNTTSARHALYKNPEVSIILPSYITDINIENVKLLYEKELKIKDAKIYRNENGNLVVNIKLNGEQTSYNETFVTEGATLIMNSDITVNTNAPTGMQTIYLNVKNEKENEELTIERDIKIVAPAGIATVSEISGYSDEEEKAVSISNKVGKGAVKALAPAKDTTVRMIAINNYEYDCDNVVILGRTPTEGNKKITKNEDLGSTFSLDVKSGIKSENALTSDQMKVYYSANKEADTNLNNENNAWTSDVKALDNVASYMIVLDDYKFKSGEVLAFNYDAEIPANLSEDEETYGVFAVYYEEAREDEESSSSLMIPRQASGDVPVGLEAEGALNIDVELSDVGAEVTELQTVEMTAKVKSNKAVANATLRISVSDNSSVTSSNATLVTGDEPTTSANTDFYTIPLTNIKKGNNEVKFNVLVGSYEKDAVEGSNLNTVNVSAEVRVQNGEEVNTFFGSNSSTSFRIKEMQDEIRMTANNISEDEGILEETDLQYTLDFSSPKNITGVEITCKLPEGLEFKDTNNEGKYDKKTRTVTWKFDEITSSETLVLNLVAENLPKDTYQKEVLLNFKAKSKETGDKEFTSNTIRKVIYKYALELNQTTSASNGKVREGEEITYIMTIKNISPEETGFVLKDYLPTEYLQFIKYYYDYEGKRVEVTSSAGTIINLPSLNLKSNENITIYVVAKAKDITTNSVEIENKVTVSLDSFSDPLNENIIKTKIIKKDADPNDPDDSNDPEDKNTTYDITGTAWLDKNKDGKRAPEEELLSDIKVYLLDSKTKKIISETKTNKNGVYEFKAVKKGNYVVAFEYDNLKYEVTLYKADNVENSVNSDVVNMELKLDGDAKKYAVTDAFVLDTNTFNLDAGFVDSPKFDLELTKGISLVQVSNKQGTKDYNFKGKDSAKVEIGEKYIVGSVIAITYEIKVTNTGAVAGFANKIVDYKSKDLSFSSTLNPEWYEDADGNLYTTSLTGREIKPGETVTVSVILTKTMTSENIGVSNNTAEIADASNDLGLEDIDSKPGNKDPKEDDYGLADVYVTIKTGGILLFGFISGVLIGIIALGAYMVNKKVLRKI